MIMNFTLGFLISTVIAFIAFRKHSLTVSGALGAIGLGTLVLGLGHWIFYVFMMTFFMSSLIIRRLVTTLNPAAHRALMLHHQKHEARTIIQVAANGGILALISAWYAAQPSGLMIYVAALSMAAATSDTWASEIGVLSHQKPRSLLKRETMETGLSGGVTPLGLWASLGGSALVGSVYLIYTAITFGFTWNTLALFILCVTGGFVGSLFDSLMGECFQAKYKTEDAEIVEFCTASDDLLIKGYRWFDNNLVNFLSNVFVVVSFSALAVVLGLT